MAEDTTTGGNIYDVTLTLDTNGFLNGPAYVDAVAIQVTGATAVSIDSAQGGAAAWNPQLGGLNAGGCGMNMANFLCAQLISETSPPTLTNQGAGSSTNTWVFDVTLPAGDTISTASDVKALYNGLGTKNLNKQDGITSAGITIQPGLQEGGAPPAVPEPGTIALFGTGLSVLVVGSFMHRCGVRKKSLGLPT